MLRRLRRRMANWATSPPACTAAHEYVRQLRPRLQRTIGDVALWSDEPEFATMISERSSSLALLREMFPGQINISLVEAARVLGMAERTAYNRHRLGTFPVRAQKSGKAKCSPVFCNILDLAAALDRKRAPTTGDADRPSPIEAQPRRKAGRPPNQPKSVSAGA